MVKHMKLKAEEAEAENDKERSAHRPGTQDAPGMDLAGEGPQVEDAAVG